MPRKGIVTTNPLYWMPVNIPEWLGKLAGSCTTEQFGALTLLVLTSWQQTPPCTLPNDPTFLAQKSGLGPRWARNADHILAVGQFYPARGRRLVCSWLLGIYGEQMDRYQNRSRANKENRGKRDQTDLEFGDPGTNGGTNDGTNRTTNLSTIRAQKEEREGVAPYGANARSRVTETPDALAPSGARAGLSSMPPVTDILRMAGIPKPPTHRDPVS